MSLPGLFPVQSVRRSASAPYCSMTSIGSTPLPRDFDILRPCASRISPWMKTFLNGISPMLWTPEKIILATQKKMMSYPVTSVSVG